MNLDTIKTDTTWNDAATSLNNNFIKISQAIANGGGGSGGGGGTSEGGDKNYMHYQSVASDEWTIVHNLGKFPSVTVIDSANRQIEGEISYISLNEVRITFTASFSGRASLN